jgi:exodeoxyribonuclease V alpha subunit
VLTVEFKLYPKQGAPENDDGFTIAKARHEGTDEVVTAKGKFGPVQVGDKIEVFDRNWKDDTRYGGDFVQVWRSQKDTTTRAGVIRYLQGLPGVGESMATAIVDQLGKTCLNEIDRDPAILLEVQTKGGHHISAKQLKELSEQWQEMAGDRQTMVYLAGLDIGDATAKRIYDKFGIKTEALIKADPYQLTEVEGIGFRLADRVAKTLGIEADDPRRLGAGAAFVIDESERDGHVCLSRAEIFKRAPGVLERDGRRPSEQQLDDAIEAMIAEGRLHAEVDWETNKESIYTTQSFIIETRLYEGLRRLLTADSEHAAMAPPQRPAHSSITDEQWSAVRNVFKERVSVLTGPPGTGKTFSLKTTLDELDKAGLSYMCMAPTGKAAKRMEESTGREATTIHRRLGWEGRALPQSVRQGADIDQGRGMPADVIVIDESSMLDMKLAERLISNVGPNTHVMFVGDPHQLPAVGAGSVLLDLIESDRVPVTQLTKIQRQAEGSMLVLNAHRIKDGQEPYWTKEEAEAAVGHDVRDDFRFVEVDNGREAVAVTMRLAADLPQHLGISPEDVMIPAPMRKGDAGVYVLNKALQRKRNPRGEQIRDGDEPLRVGDVCMNTVNRYARNGSDDPDIMNGDVGKIVDYDKCTNTVVVEFDGYEGWPVRYNGTDDIASLKPSYANTTHKYQGSEAPAVIAPIIGGKTGSSRMINRNLVYTALTRAKTQAVLVGSKQTMREALARDGTRRNTTLDLRVGRIEQRVEVRMRHLDSVDGDALARRIIFGADPDDAPAEGREPAWLNPDARPSWAPSRV